MRRMLLAAVLTALPLSGAETEEPRRSLREELHAQILASLPPLPAVESKSDAGEPEDEVIVLEPLIVSESGGERALEQMIEREERKQEAERFTAAKGGTIYRKGRIVFGLWPDGANLAFLKFSF